MTKTVFMEKYPVFSLEISKNETKMKSVNEVVDFLKNKIDNHKIAKFIAIFDHYSHTTGLEGEINPEILDAQNIIFCFGPAIPTTKILAVRPRSIGICELKDKFVIDFIEAPKEQLNDLMQSWIKELI